MLLHQSLNLLVCDDDVGLWTYEANSLQNVVALCNELVEENTHYIIDSKHVYKGYYSASRVLGGSVPIDTIRLGVVDFWMTLQEYEGKKPDFDALFPIEFATNVLIQDGVVSLVSRKLLCLSYPYPEEFSVDHTKQNIIDFIWNVLNLELRTSEELIQFFQQEKNGYLLTPDECVVLVEHGKHEIFKEEDLWDTRDAVSSMVALCGDLNRRITRNLPHQEILDIGE